MNVITTIRHLFARPRRNSRPGITVAFLHIGDDHVLPRIMLASVRRAMPEARIVQLTDETTAPMAQVDEVVRKPYDGTHLMTFRLRHMADLQPRNTLFLDTDVVVQHDLAFLFGQEFDVALTRRTGSIPDPNGVDGAALMPYNTGVMLSKASGWDFWRQSCEYCESLHEQHRRWWGDQFAVREIAARSTFRVLDIPCDIYNYSPTFENEDVSARFVVHYKGRRKAWMLARAAAELNLNA